VNTYTLFLYLLFIIFSFLLSFSLSSFLLSLSSLSLSLLLSDHCHYHHDLVRSGARQSSIALAGTPLAFVHDSPSAALARTWKRWRAQTRARTHTHTHTPGPVARERHRSTCQCNDTAARVSASNGTPTLNLLTHLIYCAEPKSS
jgi:hypothetical protein